MTRMMTTEEDQAAHIKIGTLITDITPQKGIDTEIQLTMAEQVVEISQEGQDIDMMGMIGEGIKTEDEGMILEMTVIQIRIITEDRQADKAIENDKIHQTVKQRVETREWEETATGQRGDQNLMGELVKEVNRVLDRGDRTPWTRSLQPETNFRGNNPGKEEDEVVLQTVKQLKNLSIVEIPIEQVNQKDKTPLTVNQSLVGPTKRRVRGNVY